MFAWGSREGERVFWGDGNVLQLLSGSSYTGTHNCQNWSIWPLKNHFDLLVIPWFKKETLKILSNHKKRRRNTQSGSLCLHCEFWPIPSGGRGDGAEVAGGKGAWAPPHAPARGPFPQVKWRKQNCQPPNKTNAQWNKRTEAPRKVSPRVWDSYQALSQNHFPGNGNIFVFGKGEGVLRRATAKTRWSLDNCCTTEGPCGRGFKVQLLRPPQWVSGARQSEKPWLEQKLEIP